MLDHILIPIDGSSASMKAAQAALALAERLGGHVTVYHAVDPVPYGFGARGAPEDEPMLMQLERRALQAGEQLVGQVAETAEKARVPCRTVVEVARPHEGIVAAADERKCDAIFMATHGRGGLKGLLLGSVASRVIAMARVAVVVYR